MISTTLDLNDASLRKEIEQMKPTDLHPGWVWNESEREKFAENLSSNYFRERFGALEESAQLTTSELANQIKVLLMENIKTSKIREKKKKCR